MEEITHELLRKKAIAFLRKPPSWNNCPLAGFGCTIIASEIVSSAGEIPDAIGWRNGSSVMIECKTSLSDFRADAEKYHRREGFSVGEQRYFLAPLARIPHSLIPDGWGLLELIGKSVKVALRCPPRELSLEEHQREKRILLSLISRIRMREFLIISPAALEEALSDEQ